jgi:hypothetical protein
MFEGISRYVGPQRSWQVHKFAFKDTKGTNTLAVWDLISPTA